PSARPALLSCPTRRSSDLIHSVCPQQIGEALASGITTMLGGGTGPDTGTNATTCTPGAAHLEMMLRATDAYPLNFGFMGKGNSRSEEHTSELQSRENLVCR